MNLIRIIRQGSSYGVFGTTDDGKSITAEVTDELRAMLEGLNAHLDLILTPEQEKVRKARDYLAAHVESETDLLEFKDLFDEYKIGRTYQKGDLFVWEGELFRVEQPTYIARAEDIPGSPGLEALFTKIAIEETQPEAIVDWFEPTSTHNYSLGQLVRFTDGNVYESGMDSNATSPATYTNPPYPTGWKIRPDLR